MPIAVHSFFLRTRAATVGTWCGYTLSKTFPPDQGPIVGRARTAHDEVHRGPQPEALPGAQPPRAGTPARLDLIVREPGVPRAPHGSTTPPNCPSTNLPRKKNKSGWIKLNRKHVVEILIFEQLKASLIFFFSFICPRTLR